MTNLAKADELATQNRSAARPTDAAVLGLLYTCGLRRADLVPLNREDFEPESGKLSVRAGKGRKQRTVYVQGGALQAMNDWLHLAEIDSGAVIMPINRGGRLTKRRMNAQSIYDMLKKRGEQAAVKAFSPHDLRRTFVGDMIAVQRRPNAKRRASCISPIGDQLDCFPCPHDFTRSQVCSADGCSRGINFLESRSKAWLRPE